LSSTLERKRKTKKPFVLVAIMLAMFMSAVEATIVSTAMPSIVSDLGGFKLYSWVFSSYLLMQTATVLIYGKLSDLFGRKPVFAVGVIIFLVGSILCGFAQSMEMLVAYRFIQGIGAGAVMTIASTIVGDMYTKQERAKIQGYLASVWGISAILGPALGAIFVQYADWVFVFWLNIPIGILSLLGIVLFLHEDIEKKKHSIDFVGSILLMLSVSSLMIILVEGGVRWQWDSPPILVLASIFLIGTFLFVLQEKKAKEPMMPFHIWNYRAIAIANVASLTTGAILIGISSFLPAFVQGVMGYSPFIAGLTLTTMSIGWPIASTVSGKLLLKIGYRKTSVIGGVFLIIGSLLFVSLSPERGPVWAAFGSFFIGAGMGLTTTSFIVSIQSTVGWQLRGIATASNNFMRQLGGAIGAALFGGMINGQLHRYLSENKLEAEIDINSTNLLLDMQERGSLTPEVESLLQTGLTISLHQVYIGILILSALSLLLVAFMPASEEKNRENSA
jgi:EmrB/QacA subfamily drug resistance transporter